MPFRTSHAWAVVASFSLGLLAAAPLDAQFDDEEKYDQAFSAERLVEMVQSIIDTGASRPSVFDGIDPDTASRPVREIVAKLSTTPVSATLEKQAVEPLIQFLRDVSGLNFVISARARELLEAEKPQIDLTVKNVSLEQFLNLLMLHLGEYRFTIQYDAVQLILKEEFRPQLVFRIYDIRDLIQRPPDFRAPKLGLGGLEEEEL